MKHKAKLYLYLIPITIFLFFDACKKDLTPADNAQPKVQLTVEDVGVTEAWLRLNIQDKSSKSQITITRNDSTIQSRITGHSALDTIIYDSELIPNHNYTYTATLLTSNKQQASSIQLTTMDTTSHDFTWQSWTFGAQGSSILYDVAIIDENNIWAVGEIYTEDTYTYDSLGNWIDPYNAVHWDGNEWELKRILYNGGFWIINTVFAFNENDISFEYAVRWNGLSFEEQPIPGILIGKSIKKMWGTSSDDLYVVGNEGLIAHYDEQNWQRIQSSTDLSIQDIWGTQNPRTEEYEILCVASNKYLNEGKKLLKIENNQVTTLPDSGLPWSLSGIWFSHYFNSYIVGDGMFKKRVFNINLNESWTSFHQHLTNFYTNTINGDEINNVAAAGAFGELIHFNGITWKSLRLETALDNGTYLRIDIHENLICAVGFNNANAVLIRGYRN